MSSSKPPKPRLRINATQVVAWLALFVTLGGTVYAAAKIDGKTIKKGSIPANRIKPDSLTGAQIDEAGLGTVARASSATEAARAGRAGSAVRAAKADRASLALKADAVKAADVAQEADSASTARFADKANSADRLGGARANEFIKACEGGAALAVIRVTPNGTPQPGAEGFNCADPGRFNATVPQPGQYRVSLGSAQCSQVFASTQGLNSAVVASPGAVCSVEVFSTRTNDPLPDEPFTIVVY
ncbi:MAG TPA: hypothetical protein VF081_04235 [Solirubrobacterales bacterium]